MCVRHMLFVRAILVSFSKQADMGTDALLLKKHLDHVAGEAYVDFLPGVFVGHAVVHRIDGNVIIDVYGRYLPRRDFVLILANKKAPCQGQQGAC